MSWLFAVGSPSIETSASASVHPVNIQVWFPLGLTDLISMLSKGPSRIFSSTSVLWHSTLTPMHDYWKNMTIGKTIALIIQTFVGKVISLLFNTLSSFFPRSKCLLILWMQSPSAMILKPKKIKSVNVSIFPPSTCHEEMGPDAMISVFLMFSFQPAFSLSSFTLSKKLFSLLHFLPLEWYHLHTWGCYFSWQSWFWLVIHPVWHFAWCTLYRS